MTDPPQPWKLTTGFDHATPKPPSYILPGGSKSDNKALKAKLTLSALSCKRLVMDIGAIAMVLLGLFFMPFVSPLSDSVSCGVFWCVVGWTAREACVRTVQWVEKCQWWCQQQGLVANLVKLLLRLCLTPMVWSVQQAFCVLSWCYFKACATYVKSQMGPAAAAASRVGAPAANPAVQVKTQAQAMPIRSLLDAILDTIAAPGGCLVKGLVMCTFRSVMDTCVVVSSVSRIFYNVLGMCVVRDNINRMFARVMLPFVVLDMVAEVFRNVVANAAVIAAQSPVVSDGDTGNASIIVVDAVVANPLMVGPTTSCLCVSVDSLPAVYPACLSLINSSAFAAAVGVNTAAFVSEYPMIVSGGNFLSPVYCMGFMGTAFALINSTAFAAAVYCVEFVSKFGPMAMHVFGNSSGSTVGCGVGGGPGAIVGPKFFVPPMCILGSLGVNRTAFAAAVGMHTFGFASQYVPMRVSGSSYGSSSASRRNTSVRSSTVGSSVRSSSAGGCVGGSVRSSSFGGVSEGCWAEPLSLARVCSEPMGPECVVGLAALAVGMGFKADGSYSPL